MCYFFKILIIFLSPRLDNSNSNHKTCNMEAMCTHLRVYPFENGKFLKEKTFTLPKGESLDVDLLHISKVLKFSQYLVLNHSFFILHVLYVI